jgi:NAD(P)H dehydrogenase (quinone)
MSIIVMGATGQLGRLVIDELLRRVPAGEVAAVVRDAERAAEIAAHDVELRVADYDEPDSLKGVVHPGDKVLLISSNDLGRRIPQHTAVMTPRARPVRHCSPIQAFSAVPAPPS